MSRLSNVVRRLETQGYVTRRPDPTNGRFVIAALTTSGYATVEAAAPGHVRAVRRSILDPLSPAQLGCLKEVGGRVARQVRSEAGEDPIGLDPPAR
jgi:DNA-binding MarR family transcriptional regulator